MTKMKKKWLYRALCAALAVTLVSGTAVMSPIADIIGTNITANAAGYTTWGNCQWKVENGKLYIKGTIPNIGSFVNIPWFADRIRNTITKVYVEEGAKLSADASYLFYNLTRATTMDLSNLDTSAATDMHHMFNYCSSLASLNISGWNTSKVTDMRDMFYYCHALTSLDLSSWNTSSVKTMEDMFYGCNALTSLNLSNWNTKNVTTMAYMFYGCNSLKSVDVNGWNTQNVTSMFCMFSGCNALKKIYADKDWNTSNVTSEYSMFGNCENLVGGKGTAWSNTKKTKEYARIDGGPASATPGYFTKGHAPLTYTVTWKNYDGTTLETDEDVEKGTMPEYNGTTPARTATAQYSYTFSGWDKAIAAVTGDVTYTAKFTETTNTYTVTWIDGDGNTLKTDTVAYGKTPVYSGATPTKEGNAQYTYTFSGWDKAIAAVTGNVTYTAQFSDTVNEYTVTWVDDDGNTLKTDTVAYGTAPVYDGEKPTKAPDENGKPYYFVGWKADDGTFYDITKKLPAVSENVTYTAVFKQAVEFEQGNTYHKGDIIGVSKSTYWFGANGKDGRNAGGRWYHNHAFLITNVSYTPDWSPNVYRFGPAYVFDIKDLINGGTDTIIVYAYKVHDNAEDAGLTVFGYYESPETHTMFNKFSEYLGDIDESFITFVNSTDSTPEIVLTYPVTGEILTQGTDYKVECNNENTAAVIGIGRFSGELQVNCVVLPREMKASITNRRKAGNNAKATLSGEWYLPKNATNIKAGIARLSTDDTNITKYDVYNNGVKKASTLKTTSGKYSFSLLMNSTHANQNLYAVTYVTYEIDGKEFISLSNVFTSYANLVA